MHTEELSPEKLLILQCCCPKPSPEKITAIERILQQQLDWRYITNLSKLHGVSALLYNAISLCPDTTAVPADILQELKQEYHSTAFINLLLLKEYQSILKGLNAAAIAVIPLKGIVLISELYHNIALRSLSDIDILLKRGELEQGAAVLRSMGYTQRKTIYERDEHFHLIFQRVTAKITITVELHWDVDVPDSPFNIRVDDFWSRAAAAQQDGLTFYRLSLEDSILFNCFHVLRKPLTTSFVMLKNLCDLAETINRYQTEIQWPVIFDNSKRFLIIRPVTLVLEILKNYFSVPIPRAVDETLRQQGFQKEMLVEIVQQKIFIREQEKIFLPGTLSLTEQDRHHSGKINIASLFTTMVDMSKYYRSLPVTSFIREIYLYCRRSIINYARILYLWLFNRDKVRSVLKQLLSDKQKINRIDQWIRG
jgi:hypothetical protein